MSIYQRMSDLGLVGGILGFAMGFFTLIASGIAALLNIGGAIHLFQSSWVAMLLGVVAIIGAFVTKTQQLIGGVTMLVAGSLGAGLVGGFYLIPSIVLLVAGLVSILDYFKMWQWQPV